MKIKSRYFCLVLLALGLQIAAYAQNAQVPQSTALNGLTPTAVPAGFASRSGYVDLLLGLAYTDNALLTNSKRVGDGIGAAGFSFDYMRMGELSLNLLGNLERIAYLHHTFGGSFFGHFYGSAVMGQSTDPLQWQLRDAFGEAVTNPLAAPTPQNLQTINDVSTGPLVNLHFGPRNRFTLFGFYSRSTYQRSPFDSQTYEGGAQFSHALSGASSLSFEASAAYTHYLQLAAAQKSFGSPVANYNIRQASAEYSARFARTTILLRGGYNILNSRASRTHGGPLYQVQLSRMISPFSTLFVSVQSQYTTNGASMTSPQAQIALQAEASQNTTLAVAQPYNDRSGALGWNFRRARTTFGLTGVVQQAIFDQTGARHYNYVNVGVVATVGRQLRPTVEVQLKAQAHRVRYSQLDANTLVEAVQLTLSKHFARTAFWFYVERIHQNGAAGLSGFGAAAYNDDLVGMYVTYDLFGERPVAPPLQGMLQLPGVGGY